MRAELSKFDRLLPEEGIEIYPNILYRDVNDVDAQIRSETKQYFKNDPSYGALLDHSHLITKGSKTGKRYCVYIDKGPTTLGNLVYTEILDNPHGMGQGDFLLHKWIYPEFRGTKYSRYASADLIHMLFISGAAKRLYFYIPLGKGKAFWDKMRANQDLIPCLPKLYAHDGPDVQKYMYVKEEIDTEWRAYSLVVVDGELYKAMDLRAYMNAIPGRTPEVVERWITEMNAAAEKVKESYGRSVHSVL